MDSQLHLVICSVKKIINSKNFKEIWNRNTQIDHISTRRRNQCFKIINKEYLSPGYRVKLGSASIIQELKEINQFL